MIPGQTEKRSAFYHKYKSFSANCMRIIDWKLLNFAIMSYPDVPHFLVSVVCCSFYKGCFWSPSIRQLGGEGCTCFENEQCVLLALNTTAKLKHISPTTIIRMMIFYI